MCIFLLSIRVFLTESSAKRRAMIIKDYASSNVSGVGAMLYYTEVLLSEREVPGESSICIFISGCSQNCKNCHYPDLQRLEYGDNLMEHYQEIVSLYKRYASCVCILGEGAGTSIEQYELNCVAEYAKSEGLKSCLYCGRDTELEPWMNVFDYVKLGSYQNDRGGLEISSTNQVMLKKAESGEYQDITYLFY